MATICSMCGYVSSNEGKYCLCCGNFLIAKKEKTRDEIELNEARRLNSIFLKGCDNFHSNKQNLLLLLYGYINFIIQNKNLYDEIPLDLIQICMPFCYNLEKLNPIQNAWSDKHMSRSTIIPFKDDIPRRLWKMKVVYCDLNESSPIQIFAGRISINFDKYALKDNDIISLLYLHEKGDIGWLKCAINDELYDDNTHIVSVSDLGVSEIMIMMGGNTKLSRLFEINSFETDLSKNEIKMKQKVFQRYFK